MEVTLWEFSSYRMVCEYDQRFYTSAEKRLKDLVKGDSAEARVLAIQHARLKALWKNVRIESPVRKAVGPSRVEDDLRLTVQVDLGELSPDEVDVELYYGRLKTVDSLVISRTETMIERQHLGKGTYLYDCIINCRDSGRYGFTARVTPRGDDLIKYVPGLITWAK